MIQSREALMKLPLERGQLGCYLGRRNAQQATDSDLVVFKPGLASEFSREARFRKVQARQHPALPFTSDL